jgi:hypothetical protein
MSKYNPNSRDDVIDSRLGLTVGKLQIIRMQFARFNARIPDIAKRYRLHPLLVKAIKKYRVWPDVMPLGQGLSLCLTCYCMTHTITGEFQEQCEKCGGDKNAKQAD